MRSSGSGMSKRITTILNNSTEVRSAEPIHRDWLGVIFGTAPLRRLTVAAALAIAVHEILAAVIPGSAPGSPPREVVSHVEVVRIAIRRLVALPHMVQITAPRREVPRRVAHSHRLRTAGRAAPARRAPTHRVAPTASSGTAAWDAVAGRAVEANAAVGLSGAGGEGTQSTGVDAMSSDEPCGFVEFSDPHGSSYDRNTGGFYVDVRMSVHFADGSQQSVILDYPWYYASENANPWSAQNVKDPNFPTRFQAPPTAKLSEEPALVQYVAQHSTADGMTLLRDCQGASERRP
jgi:hypothetical protein